MGMGMSDMHNWNVSFHYSRGQEITKMALFQTFIANAKQLQILILGTWNLDLSISLKNLI